MSETWFGENQGTKRDRRQKWAIDLNWTVAVSQTLQKKKYHLEEPEQRWQPDDQGFDNQQGQETFLLSVTPTSGLRAPPPNSMRTGLVRRC
jgi:hypothetical protein